MYSSFLEEEEKMQGNDKIYKTFDAGFKKNNRAWLEDNSAQDS